MLGAALPLLHWPLAAVASQNNLAIIKPAEIEIVAALLLAAACGATIGVERSSSERPAGVRTMSLVSMGSCIFGIISIYGFNPADRSRVAASVASGVGFIGAGVITRMDSTSGMINVKGLTTASTIWIAAAMGLACGSGMYFTALISTALTIFVLRSNRFRRRLANRLRVLVGDEPKNPPQKPPRTALPPTAPPARAANAAERPARAPSPPPTPTPTPTSTSTPPPPTPPTAAPDWATELTGEAQRAVEAAQAAARTASLASEEIQDRELAEKMSRAAQEAVDMATEAFAAASAAKATLDAGLAPARNATGLAGGEGGAKGAGKGAVLAEGAGIDGVDTAIDAVDASELEERRKSSSS